MDELFVPFEELEHSVLLLAKALVHQYSPSEWPALVEYGLEDNQLKSREKAPKWIVDFVKCLAAAQETELISFQSPRDNTNLERRCMGFIDSIVGGEWEFDGESESVAFDSIGVQGLLSYEGDTYYVITYQMDFISIMILHW